MLRLRIRNTASIAWERSVRFYGNDSGWNANTPLDPHGVFPRVQGSLEYLDTAGGMETNLHVPLLPSPLPSQLSSAHARQDNHEFHPSVNRSRGDFSILFTD